MRGKILLFIIFLAVFSSFVFAREQMMSFQGDALFNNAAINNGNLTVVFYSTPAGGTPVYNETFNLSINNGRFDVVLGNHSENLKLDWGKALRGYSFLIIF